MVEAAKRLHVKEHVVLDGSGNPVKLAATVECKGIVGSDDRSKSISKNNNVLFLFLNAQWFFWVLEILYKLLLGVLCVCVGGGGGGASFGTFIILSNCPNLYSVNTHYSANVDILLLNNMILSPFPTVGIIFWI